MQFDWDESNEDHIALHGISRSEVEEALSDPLGDNVGFSYVDGEERFRYVGATIRGRLLIVAFTIREEFIRPVTAFDADRYTVRRYREGNTQ
jgi:uncharacterized DUF497 family protein